MPAPTGYQPLAPDYDPTKDVSNAQNQVAPPGYEPFTPVDQQQTLPPAGQQTMLQRGPFKTLGDITEGVGSGVANSISGGMKLVKKGANAMGIPFPNSPQFLDKAGAPVQYDASGNPVEPSTAFKLARGGEQMGEFFVPGGEIAKGVEAAGKFGKLAEFGAKVGGEAASAGAITGAQSGGDVDAAKNAALLSGAMVVPFAGVEAALKAIKPATLYAPKAIVDKIEDRFRGNRLNEIVGQAIDNKIVISAAGAKKARAIETMGQGERDALIAAHPNSLVNFSEVSQPLLEFRDLARRFGMTGTVNTIDSRLRAVADEHGFQPATPGTPASTVTSPVLGPNGQPITHTVPGTPPTAAVPPQITVPEAQDLKNFGQSLAHDAFGRLNETADATKIHQVLSEGLMKSLETMIPEIKGINRSIQNTKIIRSAIEDYVNANPELASPRVAMWAWFDPKAALTVGMLQSPRFRSALAVAAHNNIISNLGGVGARIAAGATVPPPTNQLPPIPQGPSQ